MTTTPRPPADGLYDWRQDITVWTDKAETDPPPHWAAEPGQCPDCHPPEPPMAWFDTWWGATALVCGFLLAYCVAIAIEPWSAGFPAVGLALAVGRLATLARAGQAHMTGGRK